MKRPPGPPRSAPLRPEPVERPRACPPSAPHSDGPSPPGHRASRSVVEGAEATRAAVADRQSARGLDALQSIADGTPPQTNLRATDPAHGQGLTNVGTRPDRPAGRQLRTFPHLRGSRTAKKRSPIPCDRARRKVDKKPPRWSPRHGTRRTEHRMVAVRPPRQHRLNVSRDPHGQSITPPFQSPPRPCTRP